MLRIALSSLFVGLIIFPATLAADGHGEAQKQLVVIVRHGEKPARGLGQLTCAGLQRSLRLPAWLAENFPAPDKIFAPDPSVKATEIHGDGQRYDYVRPLLTIAPTAIALGMPIDTQLPFYDPGLLADKLLAPEQRDLVIYVAWEHLQIMNVAQVILRRFDSDARVPDWPNSDYDTVFAFHITWGEQPEIRFQVEKQSLGELPETCP
jgi:hypothetical protein